MPSPRIPGDAPPPLGTRAVRPQGGAWTVPTVAATLATTLVVRRARRAPAPPAPAIAALPMPSLAEGAQGAPADVAAGTFPMLMAMMDLKDRYTGRHSLSVGRLCRMLAGELGWSRSDLALSHITGLLHDVGKIGVPDAILRKPGAPTAEEWELLRRHPDWGADALGRLPLAAAVIDGVRSHHERWDGSGYPRGLSGVDIPTMGRVVALCDSLHAMISVRPFRPALGMADARTEIGRQAGVLFDPDMSAALLRVLADVDRVELILPGDDFVAEWRAACDGIDTAELYAAPAERGTRQPATRGA